jgi:hypothetical protein
MEVNFRKSRVMTIKIGQLVKCVNTVYFLENIVHEKGKKIVVTSENVNYINCFLNKDYILYNE